MTFFSALSTARKPAAGGVGPGSTAMSSLKSPPPRSRGPYLVRPTMEPGSLPRTDPRWLSPNETVGLSTELYVSGHITYHEHLILGSPAELHPDYDRTIGALSGRRAEPDCPRDVLADWEARLAFERRFGASDPVTADRVARIVGVLRSLARSAIDADSGGPASAQAGGRTRALPHPGASPALRASGTRSAVAAAV